MPTKPVSAGVMREGGKHWTKAELESRADAAAGLTRKHRVTMRIPEWLSADAREVWNEVRRKLHGIEMLDNLDAELLAIYCDAVVHYRKASRLLTVVGNDAEVGATDEQVKATQAWARIVATYADKLGLSPASRARLAKKKAEDKTDPFKDAFGE